MAACALLRLYQTGRELRRGRLLDVARHSVLEKIPDPAPQAATEVLDEVKGDVLYAHFDAVVGGLRDPKLFGERDLWQIAAQAPEIPGKTVAQSSHNREK